MDLKKYLDDKCIEIIIAGYEQGFRQKAILSTLETYGHKRKDDKAITQPFLSTVLIELGKRSNTLSKRKKDNQQELHQLEQELEQESKEVIEVDNNIVFEKEGKLFTNSLYVAKVFDKLHKNVLRDIENLDCSNEFKKLNFEPSYYLTNHNKQLPMFEMTEKGFSLLAFGFTGAKAIQFKEMYLNKFEDMREQLKKAAAPVPTSNNNYLALFDLTLQSLKEQENKILSLENKFNVIETKLDMQEYKREKLLNEMSTCEYSDRLPLEVPVRKKITTIVNAYVLNKFPNSDDKNYSSVWSILDKEIYKRLGLDIYTRLENLKSKGIRKTRLDIMEDLNILDAVYDIASFIFKIKKEV